MIHATVDPPPWVDQLAVDHRGFRVPAETPWSDDGPRLSALDDRRKIALGFLGACSVCGYPLPAGYPGYRGFAQSDAAALRVAGRRPTPDAGGPGHLSCMLFSAFACPYLRTARARIGQHGGVNAGAVRGSRAAVMGFETVDLLLPGDISGSTAQASPAWFGYTLLVDDIHYRDADELVDRYRRACKEDDVAVDRGRPRSYWKASSADRKRLARVLASGEGAVGQSAPVYATTVQQQPYFAFHTPLIT